MCQHYDELCEALWLLTKKSRIAAEIPKPPQSCTARTAPPSTHHPPTAPPPRLLASSAPPPLPLPLPSPSLPSLPLPLRLLPPTTPRHPHCNICTLPQPLPGRLKLTPGLLLQGL
ncbi:hypothetical protein ZWY2020_052768 [Hordeum vulgare]|nr:hypothetical protein ZWY2020_052768 [Hordeum vulgare]